MPVLAGQAVGSIEQDLLERAGQVAVPYQGGGGGQRMAGDAYPGHVAGTRRAGEPDHAGRGPGDDGGAGQHASGPAGCRWQPRGSDSWPADIRGQGPASALCGRVPHMEETRTEKISVNLTPSVLARLDDMRARRRWTRSTAAAVLIEHGLDSEDRMTALAGQATTSQEYTALTQENLGSGGRGR